MKLVELAYFTDDVPAMAAYYRALSGTEPLMQADGIAIFLIGGTKILIHRIYEPHGDQLPPRDHVAYEVSDVDEACRELAERGIVLDVAPRDFDWGRAAYLSDPAGHTIELIQAK